MEDLRRPSQTREGQEVDKNILKICESMYKDCYLSQMFVKCWKNQVQDVVDAAYQVQVEKISIGTKIAFGPEVTVQKLQLLQM